MIALTQVQADVDAAGYNSILNVFLTGRLAATSR